jgi:hypothetical protein
VTAPTAAPPADEFRSGRELGAERRGPALWTVHLIALFLARTLARSDTVQRVSFGGCKRIGADGRFRNVRIGLARLSLLPENPISGSDVTRSWWIPA